MPGTGEALRIARLTHRFTVRDLGAAIDRTGAAICYYERNDAVPDAVIAKLPLKMRAAVAEASIKGHEAAIAALRKLTRCPTPPQTKR